VKILMIRDLTMNNLTVIILVSFSVINILYMGSDWFTRKEENVPNLQFGECRNEEPDQAGCQKCQEFLGCQAHQNEKIVRKTKTSTKSKILGNGDLVEQTTVTEVIETITHGGNDEIDGRKECLEETRSYHDCLETCKDNWKETETQPEKDMNWYDIPAVPFGCKSTGEDIDNAEKPDEDSKPFLEREKNFEQLIPNSTSITQVSELTNTQPTDDEKQDYTYENLPPLPTQLPTGLQCCLSRLVTSAMRSWTFYFSGLIRDIPIYCTDRCLYTRANDSNSYCFANDKKASSCITNITKLMRLEPNNFRVELDDLKTNDEIFADSKTAPVIKLAGNKRPDVPASCCPVKQVMGEGEYAGLFVLCGKTPDRRAHCLDNCIYMKVGDIKQTKYCFGPGNLPSSCHQKVPSISILLNTNTTVKERPLRLDESKNKDNNVKNVVKKLNVDIKSNDKPEKTTHNVKVEKNKEHTQLKSTNNTKPKANKKKEDVPIKSKTKINEVNNENEIPKLNINKKTESDNLQTPEVLLPLLLKNEPVKLVEDELPVAIEDVKILDDKVYIHNGIHIRKMPKKESIQKQVNDSQSQNQTENIHKSMKQNETKLSENGLEEKIIEFNQKEERTVMVVSPKCSTGVPMKIRRIYVNKKEEPLSTDKDEQPLKIGEEGEFQMKLIKIPDLPAIKNKSDKDKDEQPLNICEEGEFQMKLIKISDLPAIKNKSCQKEPKKHKIIKNCTGKKELNAINKQENISSEIVSNLNTVTNTTLSKNGIKTANGKDGEKQNKTKSTLLSNDTRIKVEKKNRCTNINNVVSAEGKRTLPYRITLPERPKLIDRQKDSDDSVKAEIPIQISCCTGKPYKLKTVPKKDGEPINIASDFREPQGFAPVKIMPTDSAILI